MVASFGDPSAVRVLPLAGGRVLASLIPGATYVEIPGDDHMAWCMPSWRTNMDRYIEFATGQPVPYTVVRKFANILCTDIVNSNKQAAAAGDTAWRETMEGHDRVTRALVGRHGGQVVGSTVFADRGQHALKGFDDPWRLYAVSRS